MNLRAFATSTRPLSEVFADRARNGAGFSRLVRSIPASDEDDDHELASDRESGPLHNTKPSSTCAPDVAAVAVPLGRAFEASRSAGQDVGPRCRHHHPGAPPRSGEAGAALPPPAAGERHDPDRRRRSRRPQARDADGRVPGRIHGAHQAEVLSQRGRRGRRDCHASPLPDHRYRDGPGPVAKALIRLAEHRVVVPPIDATVVADVVEAVTATRPTNVDASMAARVTIKDLAIAVRDDVGAERSLERLQRLAEPQVTYDVPPLSELSGLGAAKIYCMEVAELHAGLSRGKDSWSEAPHGLLVSGPPGTGKTSLMRSLARELPGVHFIATSYAQWQSHKSGHLGDVTSAIRATFSEAIQHRPSIIYIDECDVLPTRGQSGKDNSWWTAIVTTLLESIQGFEQVEGVFVCASCNDPTRLDPALTRAGRLDHHIRVELPDVAGLIGIFRTHLRSDCAGADLRVAARTYRGRRGKVGPHGPPGGAQGWQGRDRGGCCRRGPRRRSRPARRSPSLHRLPRSRPCDRAPHARHGHAEIALDRRRRRSCAEHGRDGCSFPHATISRSFS